MKKCKIVLSGGESMNRISELRKKAGLTQGQLGEILGMSQQAISKYENSDENISGDILIAMSKIFKVPIEDILCKEEKNTQKDYDTKREIFDLYKSLDQYNRDTWIILGKRLLGGQLQEYSKLLDEKK